MTVKCIHLSHIILNIISFTFLIIGCILIISQTIINMIYNYSNDKKILAEKLVYQEFSHDVYSNINNKILYDFEAIFFDNDCPSGKEVLQFPIKIDSYYDCENINNNELEDLDEDICQNRISSNYICCQKDCCENNVYINQKICRDKNDDEERNDIRKKKCQYFNVYNGKFTKLYYSKICAKRYEHNYEYLLFNNEKNTCDGFNCSYIESKNDCICDGDLKYNSNLINLYYYYYSFYLNQNSLIVKNIFSELNPNYFEYEMILKESILKNQKKITKNEQKNVDKYKVINIKNIYDAFFKDKDLKDGNKNYYSQNEFLFSELINREEMIFKNVIKKEYMMNKTIKWYTRNYIGFKDSVELQKFKKFFDEDDPTNNPLYKISEIIYPNWETIIILFLFLFCYFVFLILQIYHFIKENNINIYIINMSNSIRYISTLILIIIYLFLYLFRYNYELKEIIIDMEIYYQIVLEKYNLRRKQKYLLTGIIFFCINFIIELINYLFRKLTNRKKGLNTPSKYTIICTLKNSFNNETHKFKFYLNRMFSEEMKRFKSKYFNNFFIEECKIEDENILIRNDRLVSENGLKNDSIILVVCEEK